MEQEERENSNYNHHVQNYDVSTDRTGKKDSPEKGWTFSVEQPKFIKRAEPI